MDEFWKAFGKARLNTDNKELRDGQLVYKIAHDLRPDIVSKLDERIGPSIDPFYSDENIGEFLKFFEEKFKGADRGELLFLRLSGRKDQPRNGSQGRNRGQ